MQKKLKDRMIKRRRKYKKNKLDVKLVNRKNRKEKIKIVNRKQEKEGTKFDKSTSEEDEGKSLCQEMSDGSLHFSSSSDEEEYAMNSTKVKVVPSSLRQIQQHMQKVKENLQIMQVCCLFLIFFLSWTNKKIFYHS